MHAATISSLLAEHRAEQSDKAPDILVLQEFRNGKTAPTLMNCLDDLGFDCRHIPHTGTRKNAVLIAARFPIVCEPWHVSLDSALAVRVQANTGSLNLQLLAGHLPHKRAQIPYFEALLDRQKLLDRPSLIIGDLNCGIPFEDSDKKTFSNTHLFQALLAKGWIDSWRKRHDKVREYSWISSRGNGYRYDHCLSSAVFNDLIVELHYEHKVRESGLSDHSALLIDIALSAIQIFSAHD